MEIMSPKKKKMYVPNDILIDILSWVPANSLLRLRWSCKYWFHLITRDTSFAKLHLHCSTTTTTINHHPHNLSVLISKPWPSGPSYTCKIFQYYIDYSTSTTSGSSFSTNNPILSGIFVYFRILGSCHGLILFSYYLQEGNETILCIWNPCTKEYKYLPKPPPYSGFDDGYQIFEVQTNFGLGYDHSIQDYKVICNVKSMDGTSIHVQVYALRTNSWKYIGSFPTDHHYYRFTGNGVFVNGALHFFYDGGEFYPVGARRILSFDFEKEMYVEISNQPQCLNDMAKSIQGTPLTMFEGSLCLTMLTIRNSVEAWVMKKDYNMNNNNQEYSWFKLYEIPHIYGLYDNLLPHRFTKDGEILLLPPSVLGMEVQGLYLFDPKNNKLTIQKVYKLHPIDQAATITVDTNIIVVYTESLVSLNSGTYIDEKGDYMHYWQEDTNSGTYIDEIGD